MVPGESFQQGRWEAQEEEEIYEAFEFLPFMTSRNWRETERWSNREIYELSRCREHRRRSNLLLSSHMTMDCYCACNNGRGGKDPIPCNAHVAYVEFLRAIAKCLISCFVGSCGYSVNGRGYANTERSDCAYVFLVGFGRRRNAFSWWDINA